MNNIKIDPLQTSAILKIFTTATAGLFAGGALYITLVENPARMTHDPSSAITQWKPSFVRAAPLQVNNFSHSSMPLIIILFRAFINIILFL